MAVFKDSKGGEWEIALPFGVVNRVRSASNGRFDLLDTKLAATVYGNFAEFWALLWHVIEPQANQRGITAEQFGDLMAADCLVSARDAFMDEWRDFFHKLQMKEAALALEEMIRQYREGVTNLLQRFEKERPAIRKKVEAKINRTLDSEFGKLLASLESTPEA